MANRERAFLNSNFSIPIFGQALFSCDEHTDREIDCASRQSNEMTSANGFGINIPLDSAIFQMLGNNKTVTVPENHSVNGESVLSRKSSNNGISINVSRNLVYNGDILPVSGERSWEKKHASLSIDQEQSFSLSEAKLVVSISTGKFERIVFFIALKAS